MSFERTVGTGFRATPRLVVGLAIALFGVVLVLDRLNLVIASRILQFWPIVIVAVGVMTFARSRRARGGGANGIILMVVGSWLLLNSIGVLQVRFWEMFWPMVLIAIGTALVVQTLRHQQEPPADRDDTVTIFAVLSGGKTTSRAARFRGGEVTIFMGGCKIDLSQATIPPGQEATIDVVAMMGGCELLVPPSWNVATPLVPVMGGVEDKRPPALADNLSGANGPAAPRLVLRGIVMMGGVEIKS